jgi:hypothetical protein
MVVALDMDADELDALVGGECDLEHSHVLGDALGRQADLHVVDVRVIVHLEETQARRTESMDL